MGVNNAGRQEEVDHQREPEHSPAKEGYRSDRNVSELSSSAWIEPASEQKTVIWEHCSHLASLVPMSHACLLSGSSCRHDLHAGCQPSGSRTSKCGWAGRSGLTTGGTTLARHRMLTQQWWRPSCILSPSLSVHPMRSRCYSWASHNMHADTCLFARSSQHACRGTASCPLQVQKAVARLPSEVKVLCISQNDSWFRDSGPTVCSSSSMKLWHAPHAWCSSDTVCETI